MLKSKAGWTLAIAYLVSSLLLLAMAQQCRDGFFCGLIAVPMLLPAGFVYLMLLADYLPSPAILQWPLVLATLLTNAVLYYALGVLLGRAIKRRGRSRKPP